MITKIILARHGETQWNTQRRFQGWSETELLPEGKRQAELLAKYFPEKPAAIYSSPLKRAFDTAKAVADRFNLPVKADERLRELSFGDWEGEPFSPSNEKFYQAMLRFFDDPQAVTVPGGENFSDLKKRAVAAIRQIIAENKGKTVAVFAHGGTNKAILSSIMQMPQELGWKINQSNTAYNIFSYDDEHDSYYIYTINNTSHLLRGEQ